MRKISPVIVIGLVLSICCTSFYIFKELKFIGSISLYAYDHLLRSNQKSPQSDRIVFVDIDENSLKEVGQWPWPRYEMAKLARNIVRDYPSVVAFDIVFSEPDRTSPILLEKEINKHFSVETRIEGLPDALRDFDKILAEALSEGPTVLGCYMHLTDEKTEDLPEIDPHYRGSFYQKALSRHAGSLEKYLLTADRLTISIPKLSGAAMNNAFFDALPDTDNVVRRIPMVVGYGEGRIYPALAMEAYRIAMNVPQVGIEYDARGIERLRIKDASIPVDKGGRIVVNFRKVQKKEGGGFKSFKSYSAIDVLSGNFPKNTFSNKIVFVGASAPGLKDLRATPVCDEFTGVEIHATIVDNLLAGDILYDPWWSPVIDTFSIILAGILLTVVVYKANALISFLLTLLLMAGTLKISMFLFASHNFIFIPAPSIATTAIIYPILTMIKFWQEELKRKKVRTMFGNYVSREVLRYLENNPESFSLAGEKTNATMFFSDVEGFTAISETLDPGKLSALLNKYFTAMGDLITKRNGYIDKYEGDLIMAEWGVPYPLEDHPLQACKTALEQMDKLSVLSKLLKDEFGCDINIRIGINTGAVTAGNMGSDTKVQYTVMGDAVNMARRLEPLNKIYGTSILIGEETHAAVKDDVEVRLLDKVIAQGKTKPLTVYELLGLKGAISKDKQEIRRFYEKAFAFHQERNWEEALKSLDKALALDADDKPSVFLYKRIKRYVVNPPPESWGGEWAW